MKDYHDLLSMIRVPGILNDKKIFRTIKNTFSNRGTSIADLPLNFTEVDYQELQKHWHAYLRKQKTDKLPATIMEVVKAINIWLLQHL